MLIGDAEAAFDKQTLDASDPKQDSEVWAKVRKYHNSRKALIAKLKKRKANYQSIQDEVGVPGMYEIEIDEIDFTLAYIRNPNQEIKEA